VNPFHWIKADDAVIAGTINGNKSFVMIAEKIGSETLLSQIVQMVNSASRSRAPIQNWRQNSEVFCTNSSGSFNNHFFCLGKIWS
jgi:cation transport ATPase